MIDFSKGPGRLVPDAQMAPLFARGFDYGIQVDDDLFFAATDAAELEDVDFLNHSCDANCGISGSLQIVAMRDIGPGEELAFDYAMSESSDYEMECRCGGANCRGRITGADWRRKDLQERYRGYFSAYLQKKF